MTARAEPLRRATIVVLTHDRRAELVRTLRNFDGDSGWRRARDRGRRQRKRRRHGRRGAGAVSRRPADRVGAKRSAARVATPAWRRRYLPGAVVHHHPSFNRDPARRQRAMLRNRLWVGLLRYPAPLLARRVRDVLAEAGRQRLRAKVLRDTARHLPWLVRGRRLLPTDVARQVELLQCRFPDITRFGAERVR